MEYNVNVSVDKYDMNTLTKIFENEYVPQDILIIKNNDNDKMIKLELYTANESTKTHESLSDDQIIATLTETLTFNIVGKLKKIIFIRSIMTIHNDPQFIIYSNGKPTNINHSNCESDIDIFELEDK